MLRFIYKNSIFIDDKSDFRGTSATILYRMGINQEKLGIAKILIFCLDNDSRNRLISKRLKTHTVYM